MTNPTCVRKRVNGLPGPPDEFGALRPGLVVVGRDDAAESVAGGGELGNRGGGSEGTENFGSQIIISFFFFCSIGKEILLSFTLLIYYLSYYYLFPLFLFLSFFISVTLSLLAGLLTLFFFLSPVSTPLPLSLLLLLS